MWLQLSYPLFYSIEHNLSCIIFLLNSIKTDIFCFFFQTSSHLFFGEFGSSLFINVSFFFCSSSSCWWMVSGPLSTHWTHQPFGVSSTLHILSLPSHLVKWVNVSLGVALGGWWTRNPRCCCRLYSWWSISSELLESCFVIPLKNNPETAADFGKPARVVSESLSHSDTESHSLPSTLSGPSGITSETSKTLWTWSCWGWTWGSKLPLTHGGPEHN